MKRYIGMFAVFLVAGCATPLTPSGNAIVVIDRQSDYKCSFVGTVTGSSMSGWDTAQDAEGAVNRLRNRAADMGGNAVRIGNMDSGLSGTTVVGEVLKCNL